MAIPRLLPSLLLRGSRSAATIAAAVEAVPATAAAAAAVPNISSRAIPSLPLPRLNVALAATVALACQALLVGANPAIGYTQRIRRGYGNRE